VSGGTVGRHDFAEQPEKKKTVWFFNADQATGIKHQKLKNRLCLPSIKMILRKITDDRAEGWGAFNRDAQASAVGEHPTHIVLSAYASHSLARSSRVRR